MQQEREQLLAQVEQLLRENESLKQQNQELQRELSNVAAPSTSLPDLYPIRDSVRDSVRSAEALLRSPACSPLGRSADRILKSLITGKGKVATTSPQYKTAARALDRFITELRESALLSTPASSTAPDGTAAPLVDEATRKLG